jgi:hypothetical protein
LKWIGLLNPGLGWLGSPPSGLNSRRRRPAPSLSAVLPRIRAFEFNGELSRSRVNPRRGMGCAAVMTVCPLRNRAQARLPSREPRKAGKLSKADEFPPVSRHGRERRLVGGRERGGKGQSERIARSVWFGGESAEVFFQAGPEGANVSEFSTQSTDDQDMFADPRIKRMPESTKA